MADDNKKTVIQPQDDTAQVQTPQQIKQAADFQALYDQGGKFKEQVEAFAKGAGGGEGSADKPTEMASEVPTAPEVEKKPELAGYMEKAGQEDLAGPIVDDYTGQVLLKPSLPQDVTVTLPLTEDQVEKGLHHQIWDSIRWLAEWCVRQIKMLHGKVKYKDKMEI